MFDILDKAMDKGRSLGADYIELRGESGFIEYIQMDDGRVANSFKRPGQS